MENANLVMGNGRNLVGQVLGKYELKEILGRGGMAEVYLGFQAALKRNVAVKVLPANFAAEEGYIQRFIREAEIAASLEHPNIVPIIDFGTEGGIPYVVMRLLRGGSLADRIRQRRTDGGEFSTLGEAETLLAQIGGALDYAHKRGIVHRDIKPNNIMFDQQGTSFLVDFGIAKPLEGTAEMTMRGTSLGTAAYMSPEQWQDKKVSPAVDQYAMGLIIYTLVTGQAPFDTSTSGNPLALMHKHLYEMPTPVHQIRPELPPVVSQVIERSIAKIPEERYETMTAFAEAFSSAIQGIEGKSRTTGFFTFSLPEKPIDQVPASGIGRPPTPAAVPRAAPAGPVTPPANPPPYTAYPVQPPSGITPLSQIAADQRAKPESGGSDARTLLLIGVIIIILAAAIVAMLVTEPTATGLILPLWS